MTTDNRTNDEQVEAAAKVLMYMFETGYPSMFRDPWGGATEGTRDRFRDAATRTLVAAQGAAPRNIVCDYCGDALPSVASRAHIPTTPSIQRLGFSADKVVCPECVQRARGAAPVLPSSGVDEAKIESLILGRTATAGARAVAACLKGQGR